MTSAKITLALVAITLVVPAAAAEDDITFYMYGMGNKSCAYWQSSQATLYAGNSWIYGYWSGLNAFNNKDHMVGSKTDANGIVAEVKKVCAEHPSMSVSDATLAVYEMLAQGK
jgi:hypothetical protein